MVGNLYRRDSSVAAGAAGPARLLQPWTRERPMASISAKTRITPEEQIPYYTGVSRVMATQQSNRMNEERIQGTGGLQIFFRSWHPVNEARGVVAIVPGFNSHSGHYLWVAEQLVASGLAVYALDLRGRGKSEGKRFHVDKFGDYVNDVASVVALVKSRQPGLPVFLLGHSAGGVISAMFAIEHQDELAGLICESFAFQVPAPDFALSIIKGLSHVVPQAHVLKLPNKDFSRDPAVVAALDNDPLIAHEVQPAHTVAEMVRADERLKEAFPLITLPLLILHGTADKVTRPGGSRIFHEAAGSIDKTLKLYEGHVHDLLNDIDKEVVMADIKGWIEAHLPSPGDIGLWSTWQREAQSRDIQPRGRTPGANPVEGNPPA